jgi:natural resistance-associated macrophage protein
LKWLVLSLCAYVATAFLVHPNWGEVAKATFLPALPKGRQIWEAIVAVLGTTISPYLFFWQSSQEVEETKARSRLRIPRRTGAIKTMLFDRMMDVGAGTFLSNLIMFFIILTAALTLHRQAPWTLQRRSRLPKRSGRWPGTSRRGFMRWPSSPSACSPFRPLLTRPAMQSAKPHGILRGHSAFGRLRHLYRFRRHQSDAIFVLVGHYQRSAGAVSAFRLPAHRRRCEDYA